MSTHQTKDKAHGRWREILPALGIDIRLLDNKHHACPICGGKDRWRFDDGRGGGEFFCSQCGPGTGFSLIQRFRKVDFKEAAHLVDMALGDLPAGRPAPVKIRRQTSAAELDELWQSGTVISPADPAGQYIIARRLTLSMGRLTLDGLRKVLRFVPSLPHYQTKTRHPGMLALFSDASGNAKQIQRTYLTVQGSKADLQPNRMFMPGTMPAGGAIRLGDPAEVMGVAEGVETALAAAQRFDMVVWAATSAVLLEKWMPPPEARRIIVFGDNDLNFVGHIAAYTLANRLLREKHEVEVRIPETPDTDWADEVNNDGTGRETSALA